MVMHVLSDMGADFDYMVGSKIKGFEVMVKLSDAPIIVLEGDEYLSSPIDRRPKFHWYKPHIAVLTGIAWDHINVFPTFDNYKQQFSKFINLIEPQGKLFYYDGDMVLKDLVLENTNNIQKVPYNLPQNETLDGVSYIVNENTKYPMQVFGNHNLTNIIAAKDICVEIGVDEDEFFRSIGSFDGASNRLELIALSDTNRVVKDFANAPSTVKYKKLVVCFELHTYSSLNSKFISQYRGCLDEADEAAIYFNPHALQIKKLPPLTQKDVIDAFDSDKIDVFSDSRKLQDWVLKKHSLNTVFLFMSSGNFDGINLNEFAKKLV